MSEININELATALVCLAATVHDANKNPDEVNSVVLMRDMAILKNHDPDDLIVWLDADGKKQVIQDLTAVVDHASTVAAYATFSVSQLTKVKTIIEDVLDVPGLDAGMSNGVRKALIRAFS